MNLMDKYRAKRNHPEESYGHKAEAIDYLRLLQTPLTEIKKPLLIESGHIKDRFYLVANEEQAREIEQGGQVAYGPEEVAILLRRFNFIEKEEWASYLKNIHMVKKTFSNSRWL